MIYLPRHPKPPSLSAQIRAAERRVSGRQRRIGIHTATITQKIGQQLTTPPNLLLASGVGFIIGELTRQTTKTGGNNGQAATPLAMALKLFSSLQTLYTALPLVLMIKSAYEKRKVAKPVPEKKRLG